MGVPSGAAACSAWQCGTTALISFAASLQAINSDSSYQQQPRHTRTITQVHTMTKILAAHNNNNNTMP